MEFSFYLFSTVALGAPFTYATICPGFESHVLDQHPRNRGSLPKILCQAAPNTGSEHTTPQRLRWQPVQPYTRAKHVPLRTFPPSVPPNKHCRLNRHALCPSSANQVPDGSTCAQINSNTDHAFWEHPWTILGCTRAVREVSGMMDGAPVPCPVLQFPHELWWAPSTLHRLGTAPLSPTKRPVSHRLCDVGHPPLKPQTSAYPRHCAGYSGCCGGFSGL